MGYLRMRANKVGIGEKPIFAAVAHLILVLLQSVAAADVADLVIKSVSERKGKVFPDEVKEILLLPVLDRLAGEMQDVCSSNCRRMLNDATTLIEDENPIETYWRRLDPAGASPNAKRGVFLHLEKFDERCNTGPHCR